VESTSASLPKVISRALPVAERGDAPTGVDGPDLVCTLPLRPSPGVTML